MGLIPSSGNAVWIQGFWRQMGWIICWRNTADFNPAEIAYLFLQSILKRAVLCSLTKWERWDSLWAAGRFQLNCPLFSPFSSIYNVLILLFTTFWHSSVLLWVGGMMTTTTSCKWCTCAVRFRISQKLFAQVSHDLLLKWGYGEVTILTETENKSI